MNAEAVPERTLDERFPCGDEATLREAYDAHGSLVYNLCRRSLGTEDAADATQEVFLSAWRARHRYDPDRGALAGWLVGIAKNRVIDVLRAKGRRVQTVDSDVEFGTPEEVGQLADRLLMAEALDQLGDRARRVVELHFYEDMTHVEISETCDIPLGTVKSDLRRSLERIRRHLEQSDGLL
jgi:RNA polymerase sigma-70 factor (ECF subfamily)